MCNDPVFLYCVTTNKLPPWILDERLECIRFTHNFISIVSASGIEVVSRVGVFGAPSVRVVSRIS